jgi:hypothetical protein
MWLEEDSTRLSGPIGVFIRPIAQQYLRTLPTVGLLGLGVFRLGEKYLDTRNVSTDSARTGPELRALSSVLSLRSLEVVIKRRVGKEWLDVWPRHVGALHI